MNLILEKIICPDCKNKVSINEQKVVCNNCKREFRKDDKIFDMLPSKLENNKISEDKVHFCKECDTYKYNEEAWKYFVDLSGSIKRVEEEIIPEIGKCGNNVLELASGNCWASAIIKRTYPEKTVVATDVSFNSLKIKGVKFAKFVNADIDVFASADAENLPFDNETFDFIFIIAALHHMYDTVKTFSEIKRVLKRGGRFMGIDGAIPVWVKYLLLGRNDLDRQDKHGVIENVFTYSDWNKFLKSAGIELNSLRPYYSPKYNNVFPNNEDEAKLMKYNLLKSIIYGKILSPLPDLIKKSIFLQYIVPVGIVIDYTKE